MVRITVKIILVDLESLLVPVTTSGFGICTTAPIIRVGLCKSTLHVIGVPSASCSATEQLAAEMSPSTARAAGSRVTSLAAPTATRIQKCILILGATVFNKHKTINKF